MGGGRAREMAKKEAENALGLSLVPWAGIAAKIPRKNINLGKPLPFLLLILL